MSEFQFDMWDMDLTDEELAAIFADEEAIVYAETWEGFESPLPW